MAGRKIRDHADAEACLEAVTRSGLRRVDWCHANGIDARSLNAWRLNLARSDPRPVAEERLRLVELVPQPLQPVGVRVRIGDVVIDVPPDFDEATFVRVVRLVASC